MTQASASWIPVAGQAALGFVLPWILAMVAIPLEMLLDSARHVLSSLAVFGARGRGLRAARARARGRRAHARWR